MKYKKRDMRGAQAQAPRPVYKHGVRVDDPNYPAIVHSANGDKRPPGRKGKPPMDPRYPPARYATSDRYAYKGPGMVLPTYLNAPLLEQRKQRKTFFEECPKHWWIWLIGGGGCVGVSLVIIMVVLYVFGDLTEGRSPVYKGHFG